MRNLSCLFFLFSFLNLQCQYGCADLLGNTVEEVIEYEAPEPYEFLHDYCENCNPSVNLSPDPLVSMKWRSSVNESELQLYRVSQPVSYKVIPETAYVDDLKEFFSNNSINKNIARHKKIQNSLKIYENCTIVLDWGVERAAWFELISSNTDLSNTSSTTNGIHILASISEFNEPYPGKTKLLRKYGNHTYRLETNDELYEGVRFTFLHITFEEKSKHSNIDYVEIQDLSLVAKIKPISYTGQFQSSCDELTEAWYTGAYGVRLNMEANDLNSILIERGDRVAIQGDGHPSIDTALVAFSSFDMIRNVLEQTDSSHKHVVDDSIMAYPLYWCLSAIDYFMASGDISYFQQTLASDIAILLDKRIADFLDPYLDITWFGWDDRVGNGWCFHGENDRCTREALLAFAALVIRVCNDFRHALDHANMSSMAKKYKKTSEILSQQLRQVPEFPYNFGVHAAANVLNADGVATLNETNTWLSKTLNDPVTICSFSQFNQYWILQAFGHVGSIDAMEHALASIKMCWGPMMKLNKGCFWEISSPEWLSFMNEGDQAPHLPSYCHPWASGVTPWLSHVLGGIQPSQPGYREFAALPYVSSTHPFVSTTIKSPQGIITVNASLVDRQDSHFVYFNATMLSPVEGIFGVRSEIQTDQGIAALDSATLYVNGARTKFVSTTNAVDLLGISLGKAQYFRFFRIGQPGMHIINASYKTSIEASVTTQNNRIQRRHLETSPFPEPKYPATCHSLDRESQGDGLIQHGKDGYVLLGCNRDKEDIINLPSYITNITVRRHGFPGWVIPDRYFVGYSDDDPLYLPLNSSRMSTQSNAKRGLGRVGLNDAGGGDINCILIDIDVNPDEHPSQILMSIYSVAKSGENRHAIRVMDGDTFNVISPTEFVDHYHGGVWWTLQYNQSVRLKFMDIKGIYISAVAFERA